MCINGLIQVAITLTSVGALALLSCEKPKVRRWSGPLGLVGQPFWIFSTWGTQWGIVVVSFLYLGIHARNTWKAWKGGART